MRFRPLLAALAVALLASPALAGRRQQVPDVVDDALAFAETDRDKAARLLEDAIANDTSLQGDALFAVMVNAGEQRRLQGDAKAASAWFSKVADAKQDTTWRSAAKLGGALISAQGGLDPQIKEELVDTPDKEVLPTQNADRYLLLALDAAGHHEDDDAKDLGKKALQYAKDDDQVLARVKAKLDAIDAGAPVADEGAGKTPIERAWLAYDQGRVNDARRLAQGVLDTSGGTDDAYAAGYLMKLLDATVPVDGNKIGVLLPTSGKYAAVGQQIKQALELGYGKTSPRKLVYEDVGETPESAVAALERLVLQDGVVGVVGTLRTEETGEVAKAAEAMHVPFVSLSQADVAEGRHWVLEGMTTQADQIDALLDFVMTKKGMKSFATFAPDNAYGHTTADLFAAAVKRKGGTVTATEFYDPESKDTVEFAKKLARVDYTARAGEWAKLKADTKKNGGDPSKVALPPTIDFDGLFIPDGAARVPLACAGLAFEEFPIGEFQPTKGARTIPLLGLSSWDSESLVTGGNLYVRGSYFTDAYHESGTGAADFEAKYKDATQRSPSPLEAVAYDVGQLLAAAGKSGAATPTTPATRAAFLDALLATHVDGTATGTEAFDPQTHAAKHHIRVLTIAKTGIVPVDIGS